MRETCELSPEAQEFYAQQARQFIPRYYHWDQLVDQYAQIYRELAGEKRHRESSSANNPVGLSGMLKQWKEAALPQQAFLN